MKKILFFLCLCWGLTAHAGTITDADLRQGSTLPIPFKQLKAEARWGASAEVYTALGKAYYFGWETKKNYKKAYKYFQKAAQKGHPQAQLFSAVMTLKGRGTPKNPQKAFASVEQLAQNGSSLAQYILAKMYQNAEGTPQDMAQSIKWLWRSSSAPLPVAAAQYKLALLLEKGVPAQLEKNPQKAFELMLSAAEAEYPLARYHTARMYLTGTGTEKNEKKAFKFMKLAAQDGLTRAKTDLSKMYRTGTGVKANDWSAFKWMHSAALAGNVPAMETTATYYHQGIGTPANRQEALFWARQAQENGSSSAKELIQKIQQD